MVVLRLTSMEIILSVLQSNAYQLIHANEQICAIYR